MMQETQCRTAARATEKAKRFVKDSNHNSAKIEQLESKVLQLSKRPVAGIGPEGRAAPRGVVVTADGMVASDEAAAAAAVHLDAVEVHQSKVHLETQIDLLREDLETQKGELEELIDSKLEAQKVDSDHHACYEVIT